MAVELRRAGVATGLREQGAPGAGAGAWLPGYTRALLPSAEKKSWGANATASPRERHRRVECECERHRKPGLVARCSPMAWA
jgi:hypothetical protein